MQDQYEPTGEQFVSSGERSITVSLLVDWNRNGLYDHALSNMSAFVHTVSVDRALQGAAPPELGFVSGSAAAQLSVTMAGEYQGKSLTSIFSPYQIDSPFWTLDPVGCEIKYVIYVDAGALGSLDYPQFVGHIRTISPDRGNNSVDITALDRVELLRQSVMFAPDAVSERHAQLGLVEAQLMSSSHMIELALRQCDVSSSPWRPIKVEEIGSSPSYSGCQVYLTGSGGKIPLVGWMDNQTRQEFPNTEAGVLMYENIGVGHPQSPEPTKKPPVYAAVGNLPDGDTLYYWSKSRQQIAGNASQVLGFTLIQGSGANSSYWSTCPKTLVMSARTADFIELQIYITAGVVSTEWDRGGASPLNIVGPSVTIPAGTSCQIHVAWDAFHANGPMAYIAAGATNSGVVDLGSAIGVIAALDPLAGLVSISHQVAMQDVYFTTTHFGGIGSGTSFKPKPAEYAAWVDNGINTIGLMPIPDKREAWDVIKLVTDAEMGASFWDENGKFRFWNFDTLADKRNSIVRTITLDDLTALDIERGLDSVRNVYAMDQVKGRAVWNNAYISQDVDEFYVPAGTRKLFKLYIDDIVSPEPRQLDRYKTTGGDPVPSWTDDVQHGYVFQRYSGGTWSEAVNGNTAGVDIICYYDETGAVVVNIYNGWAEPIRLASGSGDTSQPAFHMKGTHIIRYDPQTVITENPGSKTKYKARTLKLTGEFYQDTSDYNDVLGRFLARTSTPTPSSDAITIAGDPRLQLGDSIRIKDKVGFGEYFDFQIYGINRTYSIDSGLTDSLSVQLVPAGGKWDDPVYGIWESTFVWT